MRKGEELRAPRYASAAASCDDIATRDIIPNSYSKSEKVLNYAAKDNKVVESLVFCYGGIRTRSIRCKFTHRLI